MAQENVPKNFMIVIREAEGAEWPTIQLEPEYPQKAEIDGKIVDFNLAWFTLIGDTQLRFVLDDEASMTNVTVEEFERYGVSTEQAIHTSIENIERTYGVAQYSEWQRGIYVVKAGSDDLASSHLLNRRFWADVDTTYPDGVVAGIPDRATLIFAPLEDQEASQLLVGNLPQLKTGSGQNGISDRAFIRVDGKWHLLSLGEEKE